jgi:hypothetical protein
MMAMRRWPFVIVAGMLLGGCASVPSGPSVRALPGSARSADDFRTDDAACRQLAASDAAATKQWRYDMTYLQCMYAKGNQIPVPIGTFAPTTAPAATTAPANPPTTPANQPAK